MAIEDTLLSIDATLKALLAAAQAGADNTTPVAERKPRAKKTEVAAATGTAAAEPVAEAATEKPASLVDGDAEGTRYWVSEANRQVYAQLPSHPSPADQSFKISTAAEYVQKKAEFAEGNETSAAPTQAPAAPEPTATAPQDAASASECSWKDEVFPAIQALNKAKGAEAIRALIQQFGLQPKTSDNPSGATVPALEKLGRNAEVRDAALALANDNSDDLGL